MNLIDIIKAANKRRHDKYLKSKECDLSLVVARHAIAAKEKANIRKA